MTPHQRTSRILHHVRKTPYQWHQCATKAKNKDIKAFFQDRVRRIKSDEVNMWKDLVADTEIDKSMKTAAKVVGDNQLDQRAGAMKRKARDQKGPVGHTPNAERKPKGRRQRMKDATEEEGHGGTQNAENQDNDKMHDHPFEGEEVEEALDSFTALEDSISPPAT